MGLFREVEASVLFADGLDPPPEQPDIAPRIINRIQTENSAADSQVQVVLGTRSASFKLRAIYNKLKQYVGTREGRNTATV